MGGDGDTSVRVKFKFEAECKVAMLESIHLTSMESLRKLIFKRFPKIQGMVERPKTTGLIAPTHLLSVSCKDMAGDYITLDDDDDLDAMDILQYRNLDFCIDVIPRSFAAPSTSLNADRWGKISDGQLSTASAASNSDRWGKISDRQLSDEAPRGNYMKKRIQCRHFQLGFCMLGERCQFGHDPTKRAESMPSNSRSNSDRWGKLSDCQLSTSERVTEAVGKKMGQCRYFQSGFCIHGESCQFVHDRTKRAESLPSPTVVDWSALSPYLALKEEPAEELQSPRVMDMPVAIESCLTDQCERLPIVSPTEKRSGRRISENVPVQEEHDTFQASQSPFKTYWKLQLLGLNVCEISSLKGESFVPSAEKGNFKGQQGCGKMESFVHEPLQEGRR